VSSSDCHLQSARPRSGWSARPSAAASDPAPP
jgi:hypothetical protein